MPPGRRSSAVQRSVAVNRSLRPRFAGAGCHLPLPKPFKGVILTSNLPGIWRISVLDHLSILPTWYGSNSELIIFPLDLSSTNAVLVGTNQGTYWGL